MFRYLCIHAAGVGASGGEAARRARKLQASLLAQLQSVSRSTKLVRPASMPCTVARSA